MIVFINSTEKKKKRSPVPDCGPKWWEVHTFRKHLALLTVSELLNKE